MSSCTPLETKLDFLWKTRFSALPIRCDNEESPGVDEVEEWREWAHRETTPDQMRIEEYLKTTNMFGATILHVGIGNSHFALRFSPHAKLIIGLTISPLELEHARRLCLPNYLPLLRNKYSPTLTTHQDVDIIVDNNPTTFACCRHHFVRMMSNYTSIIKNRGVICTDRVGLAWVTSAKQAHPRWKFDFNDWTAIGHLFGLEAKRVTRYVYTLSPF